MHNLYDMLILLGSCIYTCRKSWFCNKNIKFSVVNIKPQSLKQGRTIKCILLGWPSVTAQKKSILFYFLMLTLLV